MHLLREYIQDFLQEAPIRDLEPVGRGLDKPGSFDKRDRKLLSNPKAIQKIRKQWEKTPFTFDIYLTNIASLNKSDFREIGMISPGDRYWDDVEKAFAKYDKPVPNSPDAITIIFNGNYGAEKVPLTGWTMAHRLGHAVRNSNAWKAFIKECSFFLRETMDELYDIKNTIGDEGFAPFHINRGNRRETEKLLAMFANQIGTMKSARENQIKRYYEFFYEMFAQYLITGEVKFNKFPERMVTGYKAFGRKSLSKKADPDMLEMYNDTLDSFEYSIAERAKNVLYEAVGKTFLM